MAFESVFAQAREMIMKSDVSGVKEHLAYQFDITGEHAGRFYMEVKDGKLHVEPYEYYDRHALFICCADTLLDMAAGKLDLIAALRSGKLRVEGNIEQGLKLKQILK